MIKNTILFLSIICASGVMTANIYTSVVDARSWGSNIPESITAARKYFNVVNPGTFFRVFSPANVILALLALILCWKSAPSTRMTLGIALAIYVAGDVFTFAYFYPRNAVLFGGTSEVDLVRRAWQEWNTMNWIRTALIGVGIFFSCLSLHNLYTVLDRN